MASLPLSLQPLFGALAMNYYGLCRADQTHLMAQPDWKLGCDLSIKFL